MGARSARRSGRAAKGTAIPKLMLPDLAELELKQDIPGARKARDCHDAKRQLIDLRVASRAAVLRARWLRSASFARPLLRFR
eukprot:14739945-Alexandrium_andersonii.AAC.1